MAAIVKYKCLIKLIAILHSNTMCLKWAHPFTAILAGPTSCGKSYFMKTFLSKLDKLVDSPIHEVLYCIPPDQPIDDFFLKFNVVRGIPDIEKFADLKPRLVILDDLMREADSSVVDLFTKGSHHFNLSIVFITQNIFNQGKGRRDISLNTHYLVCFNNPRDRQQISTLSRQVSPDNVKYIQEAFKDATSVPFGYLLFDLKQSTPDKYRYRTSIFDTETPSNIVYLPK